MLHWAAFRSTSETESSVAAANRYGHGIILISPPDFYLWGYLMDKVYVCRPETIGELNQAISLQVPLIQQEEGVLNDQQLRPSHPDMRLQRRGRHFEQEI